MQLNEPKKKKRVRLQAQPPLPVTVDESGEWRIYTAHLSASGTCIVDPGEMEAVYSMGFFGKGSLSRSYPSFGRRRFGAPPIARKRQWVRRQKWLEELQNLNEKSDSDLSPERDDEINEDSREESTIAEKLSANHREDSNSETPALSGSSTERESARKFSTKSPHELEKSSASISTKNSAAEEIGDGPNPKKSRIQLPDSENAAVTRESEEIVGIADVEENSATRGKWTKVDEVVLDSTEDEEVCEIVEKIPDDEDDALDERSVHEEISVLRNDERADDCFDDESPMDEEPDPYEVLVLPDTESDNENYLKNVESRIEKEGFPVNETLHLTFEETFFLMYALGCLRLIHYDGSVFGISNAWNHFQMQDNFFVQKYVVYHYFRSKGWVVKPGLKYGGDFLLYKQGPPFYHASYIVIVEVMNADTLIREDAKSMQKLTWKRLIGIERLSETISKEILFAQILWPSSVSRNGNAIPVEALSEFTVRELLWRRWNPKRKHEVASVDEEDSDSA